MRLVGEVVLFEMRVTLFGKKIQKKRKKTDPITMANL